MRTTRTILAAVMLVAAAACGGGSDSPTSPTPPPTQQPPPSQQGTTITIGAGGVMTPPVLTVARGTRVTFINNDSRARDINDDPHPTHGDCPPIQEIGFIQTGQTKQTGALNTARTCGYHDHNEPTVRGTIIVQ